MSTLQTEAPKSAPVSPRVAYATPRVNLHQSADGYTLEVELPGVSREGLEISVDDGQLVITGQRAFVEQPGKAVYRERTATAYRRVFDLDPSIDPEKISARLDQGLLIIGLQKADAVKPRKIEVS